MLAGVPGRCRQHACAKGVIFPADALGSNFQFSSLTSCSTNSILGVVYSSNLATPLLKFMA